jgi:hypothetical protein
VIVIAIIIHIFNIEHGLGLPQCGGLGELLFFAKSALFAEFQLRAHTF